MWEPTASSSAQPNTTQSTTSDSTQTSARQNAPAFVVNAQSDHPELLSVEHLAEGVITLRARAKGHATLTTETRTKMDQVSFDIAPIASVSIEPNDAERSKQTQTPLNMRVVYVKGTSAAFFGQAFDSSSNKLWGLGAKVPVEVTPANAVEMQLVPHSPQNILATFKTEGAVILKPTAGKEITIEILEEKNLKDIAPMVIALDENLTVVPPNDTNRHHTNSLFVTLVATLDTGEQVWLRGTTPHISIKDNSICEDYSETEHGHNLSQKLLRDTFSIIAINKTGACSFTWALSSKSGERTILVERRQTAKD